MTEGYHVFPLMGRGTIHSHLSLVCKECGEHSVCIPYREEKGTVIESGQMQGSNYRDIEVMTTCPRCGAVRYLRIQSHSMPNYCLKGWDFTIYGWHCPEPVAP